MSIDFSYTIHVDLQTNVYRASFNYLLRDIRTLVISFLAGSMLQFYVPLICYAYFVLKIRMMKFQLENKILDYNTFEKNLRNFKTGFIFYIFFILSLALSELYLVAILHLYSQNIFTLSFIACFFLIIETITLPQLFSYYHYINTIDSIDNQLIRKNFIKDMRIIVFFIFLDVIFLILNLGENLYIPVGFLFLNVLFLFLILFQNKIFDPQYYLNVRNLIEKSIDSLKLLFKYLGTICFIAFVTSLIASWAFHLDSGNLFVFFDFSLFLILIIIIMCLGLIYIFLNLLDIYYDYVHYNKILSI